MSTKKHGIGIVLIAGLFLLGVYPSVTLGASDTAKNANQMDRPDTSNAGNAVSAQVGKKVTVTISPTGGTNRNVNRNENKNENDDASSSGKNTERERELERVRVKLGPDKIKEYILTSATGSGDQKRQSRIQIKPASPSAQIRRRAVSGVITSIDGSTLTLEHIVQREMIYKVTFDESTIITGKVASASVTRTPGDADRVMRVENRITAASLAVGQRIMAVGTPVDGGGILAKRIHIIPGLAIGALDRQPVASASPMLRVTMTPSVTPSVRVSSTPNPEVVF